MNEFFQNPRVARSFVALLFSASLALVALAFNTIKEFSFIGRDIAPVTMITVAGKGEAFTVPDIAEFSFSVVKEAKTVPEAQKQATDASNAILAYLKTAGIEDKDVKTIDYSVNPQYEWQTAAAQICRQGYCPPEGKQVLIGYQVNQSVSVKVRKIDDAGKLLSGVGEKGATNISGIQFTVDEPEKVEREARQKAIADAKTKADALAKDLGVKIVRIVQYSDSGAGTPPAYPMMSLGKAADSAQSIAPEIPVG